MKAEIFNLVHGYIQSEEDAYSLTEELCDLLYGTALPPHKVIEIAHTYRKRLTPDGWELCFWNHKESRWNNDWELFPNIGDIV